MSTSTVTLRRPVSAIERRQRSLAQMDDEDLMQAFQNGSVEAFDLLVARYKDPLAAYLYRFLGDARESEDLLQETFLRVFRNRHSYRRIARFSTWLYTIAGNLARSEYRKRRRRRVTSLQGINRHSYRRIARFSTWLYTIAGNLARSEYRKRRRRRVTSLQGINRDSEEYEVEIPDETFRPDTSANGALQEDAIQKAFAQIPDEFREVVVLRDIQQLAYEEIAEITGLPMGTVKSRINRGRTKLQQLLRDVYTPDEDDWL